jgi:DNA-directed RNA polymerase specialized sigma24 family protein
MLLRHARAGEATARAELYDRHATALFNLAYAISGNAEAAASAVSEAFREACADPATGDAGRRVHQVLSRLTFLACRNNAVGHPRLDPAPEGDAPTDYDATETDARYRALLGLTMHGQRTYRDAATLLDLEPAEAAAALRMMLREHARSIHGREPSSSPSRTGL